MWIHLLTLGLIDGAGGSTPPDPTPPFIDTSGGGNGGGDFGDLRRRVTNRTDTDDTARRVAHQNQHIIHIVMALVVSGALEEMNTCR